MPRPFWKAPKASTVTVATHTSSGPSVPYRFRNALFDWLSRSTNGDKRASRGQWPQARSGAGREVSGWAWAARRLRVPAPLRKAEGLEPLDRTRSKGRGARGLVRARVSERGWLARWAGSRRKISSTACCQPRRSNTRARRAGGNGPRGLGWARPIRGKAPATLSPSFSAFEKPRYTPGPRGLWDSLHILTALKLRSGLVVPETFTRTRPGPPETSQ